MPDISTSKLDFILTIGIIVLLAVMIYNHRRAIPTSKKDSVDLGVQDLIEKVKTELAKTEESRISKGQIPLLELKDFDLEINFVVTESYKGSGTFGFKVVTLGGQTDVSSEKIQKIKLHMTVAQPHVHEEKASTSSIEVDDSTIILTPPKERKRHD